MAYAMVVHYQTDIMVREPQTTYDQGTVWEQKYNRCFSLQYCSQRWSPFQRVIIFNISFRYRDDTNPEMRIIHVILWRELVSDALIHITLPHKADIGPK